MGLGVLARLRVLAPLELRDFRLLWTGMVASLLGDGVFFVAMAWQVYLLSNAPTALAAVGFAITLPQVLLLIVGGVVSDRVDRRKAMIGADVVRGLAIGAIGVLALSGSLHLGSMIALVVLYGGATAFFGPAYEAFVPEIVPTERLTEANALDQFMRPAASRLAGPALGGVVIAAAGVGPAFLLDAASFAFSALCVARIAPRPAAGSGRLSLEEVWAGMRFVRAHVWLWGTFLGATASYLLFIGPSEVLLPFVIKNDMHGGAQALGLVLGAGGVGALFAAALAGQRGMPRRHMTWMYVTWSLATLAIAGFGLATASWQLAVASLLFNGFEAAGTVWWATTKARLVPPELRGRVSSLDWFISIGLVPLSYAFTAPLAAALGASETLIVVGSAGALITLAPLFLRGMRDVERAGMALDRVPVPLDRAPVPVA
ncbi:MAG TPA: MFS transporter [Solirubrobacteraceae bacterium]|jgi:MFS family permease|nr:MFS transporter [Solirubrobacteraceae bacterium]